MSKGRQIPTEPGWYWCELKGLSKQIALEVVDSGAIDKPNSCVEIPYLIVRLPRHIDFFRVEVVEGVWGARISEAPPIERVCDCGRGGSGIKQCEHCGKDICSLHSYTLIVYSASAILCTNCKDTYNKQAAQLLRSFKQGVSI